jgi:hypothetical protein
MSETNYRVEIHELHEDAGRPVVTGQDGSLAWALYYAISANRPARLCGVLASVITYFAEWGEFRNGPDYFPDYGANVERMIDAASEIHEGWEAHDRKFGLTA